MGSTYIAFHGGGFDANDAVIELWLSLLVDEFDTLADAPAWLAEVREDWEIQATEGFNFGSDPHLDRFVTDESRRDLVIMLSGRVFDRLAPYGEIISADQLNELSHMRQENGYFARDLPTSTFTGFGRQMVDLLKKAGSA